MSVSLDTQDMTREAFQSLTLSIPVDKNKYAFMYLFLDRVTSVNEEKSSVYKDAEISQDKLLQSLNLPGSHLLSKRSSGGSNKNRSSSQSNRNSGKSSYRSSSNSSNGYYKDALHMPAGNHSLTNQSDPQSEIIPDVLFPQEIWTSDHLCVRDVKIKVSVLNEINVLMEREISNTKLGTPVRTDANVLQYYEKLIAAYGFLELPSSQASSQNNTGRATSISTTSSSNLYMREENEDDVFEESGTIHHQINRTPSNTLSINLFLKTYHLIFGNNTQGATAAPNGNGLSQAFSHGSALASGSPPTQFGNFTANGTTGTKNAPSSGRVPRKKRFLILSSSEVPEEVEEEKQSRPSSISTQLNGAPFNSLLNKLRLYSKIRKGSRDLTALASSLILNPTSVSNRNSITTTSSIRRGSLQPHDDIRSQIAYAAGFNGLSPVSSAIPLAISSKHSSMSSLAGMTLAQRQEIQKNKQEYFLQLKRLLRNLRYILSVVNDNLELRDLVTLLDFVKRYVVRLILVDTNDMVLEYLAWREYNMCRRV